MSSPASNIPDNIKELYDRLAPNFFWSLPFNKLMRLSKMISYVKNKKYGLNKTKKYGDSKAMSSDDVVRFFSAFKPEEYKFKVVCLLMAFLGLRIGEVIRLKKDNLDFRNKRLLVQTEKQRGIVSHSLFLHERVYGVLLDYLDEYSEEINVSGGWLFPAKTPSRCKGHISHVWLRKVFRRVCDRAELSIIYGERESINGLPIVKAKLYLYTPHSLRHSLGTYLASKGTKLEIIQKILRHKSLLSTMVYVKPSQEEVDYAFYKAFKDK